MELWLAAFLTKRPVYKDIIISFHIKNQTYRIDNPDSIYLIDVSLYIRAFWCTGLFRIVLPVVDIDILNMVVRPALVHPHHKPHRQRCILSGIKLLHLVINWFYFALNIYLIYVHGLWVLLQQFVSSLLSSFLLL